MRGWREGVRRPMNSRSPAFAVVAGGLVAGALDLCYALLFSASHGVAPMRILKSVASGLLGRAALDGGAAMAVLGTLLHFAMALVMAGAYYLTSTRWPTLARRPLVGGAAYGVLLYVVMNFVVIPLSAFPGKVSLDPTLLVANVMAHVVLVGIPIALFVRRVAGRPQGMA